MIPSEDPTRGDGGQSHALGVPPGRVRHFDMEVQLSAQLATVFMHGELDVAEAEAASACLDGLVEAGQTALFLDLTGVTFIDSRGITVLVRTWNRLRACGGRMMISPSPRVAATLAVAGLDELLVSGPACDTQAEPGANGSSSGHV